MPGGDGAAGSCAGRGTRPRRSRGGFWRRDPVPGGILLRAGRVGTARGTRDGARDLVPGGGGFWWRDSVDYNGNSG